MTKFIFITGNTIESKKSFFVASLGALLIKNNLKINIKKITKSKPPRTFVTSNGFELDLDLGHYERIAGINTNSNNNLLLSKQKININKIINFIELDSIKYDIILIDSIEIYYNINKYFFEKYGKTNFINIHFLSKETPIIKINYPNIIINKLIYSNIDQIPYISYKIPYLLYDFHMEILQVLNIKHINNYHIWEKINNNIYNLDDLIYIYIIIKYTDSYLSLKESLEHASYYLNKKIKIIWVDPTTLTKDEIFKILKNKKGGILVPGGFGHNGFDNKIEVIRFARENNIPFLGICYGMQIMIIEYAKNVLNIYNASTEEIDYFNRFTHIVHLIESKDKFNYIKKMRLGNYIGIVKKKDSIAGELYKSNLYIERYRHSYKINNKYINEFEKKGLYFTGSSLDEQIMEISEVPINNFFMGVQFHPELNSTIFKPNPVILSFIKSSLLYIFA